MKSRIRVSIVIPAYNEERYLAACLQAIEQQTIAPFEVIVVDNNSSDATADVARQFSFVTVIHEPKQGVMHARNAGFDAAKGDVIGRIDVDTILSPTWVATVQQVFADPTVDAASGSIGFYDVPFRQFFGRLDRFFRNYLAVNLARRNELFLFGGNMAIRRTVWRGIAADLCHNKHFHEDIDMAAHFAHSAYRLVYAADLRADVSARRVDSDAKTYYHYVFANSRTYAAHRLKGRYYMYPVELLVLIFYVPLRLLYRSYSPQTNRFSLRAIFNSDRVRVSPISDL